MSNNDVNLSSLQFGEAISILTRILFDRDIGKWVLLGAPMY